MTVPMRQIGQVCSLQKGGVNPQKFPAELFAHYSIPAFDEGMKPSMDLGASIRSQKTAIQSGSVLVSKLNPRIPRVWHVQDEQEARRICSTEFVPLLPKRNVLDPRYLVFALLHLLASGAISGSTSAATKSRERAKPADIAQMLIPVPPLERQTEIADLLSRADGIVRLRREAAAKAAELIPALFIHHFGDPATNPMGWPVVPLSGVAEVISGVAKGRKLTADEGVELPYMRVANVKDGYLDLGEVKTIEIKRTEVEKLRIEVGDLLMTEGGDPDKLGRGALWRGEIENCVHQNHVFKVRSHRDRLVPEYLRSLVGSHYGKSYFLSVAKKTTGIASINKTQLSAFPVQVPPLPQQEAFRGRVEAAESIQRQQNEALAKAQAAFDALLAQAFAPTSPPSP